MVHPFIKWVGGKTQLLNDLRKYYPFSHYNNIYKYYVKVVLSEETLYESNIQEYNYLIVTIDENTLTFAIEPISELVYNEKIKGED